MNENGEGRSNPQEQNPELNTPNLPLEPNQMDELAPEPQPEIKVEAETVEVTAEPETTEVVAEEVEVTETVENEPETEETTTIETVKAPEVENTAALKKEAPKKSNKMVWIITAIVAVLVAIGCAVAAVLLLNPAKNNDGVTAAIVRLLNNETPKNVAAKGTLTLDAEGDDTTFESIRVDFDTEAATAHKTSKVAAAVTLEMVDGSELAFDVEGTMVASGDIYVKIDGIVESVKSLIYEQLDCDPDYDCPEINVSEIEDFWFASIEGEWIRFSADFVSAMDSSLLEGTGEMQCLTNAFSKLTNGEIKEAYEKNSFVTSTTENVKLAAHGNTLYKLGIDSAKLTDFTEATKNTEFAKEIQKCGGDSSSSSIFASTPTLYAEVGDDNNFSRIYFDGDFGDEIESSMTLDFALSYPSTIEIVEPAKYVDAETILSEIFGSFGAFDGMGGELDNGDETGLETVFNFL